MPFTPAALCLSDARCWLTLKFGCDRMKQERGRRPRNLKTARQLQRHVRRRSMSQPTSHRNETSVNAVSISSSDGGCRMLLAANSSACGYFVARTRSVAASKSYEVFRSCTPFPRRSQYALGSPNGIPTLPAFTTLVRPIVRSNCMCVWPQTTSVPASPSKRGNNRSSGVRRVKTSSSLRGVPWQKSTCPMSGTSNSRVPGQLRIICACFASSCRPVQRATS